MKKKLFIFLLFSFIIFLITLYFYREKQKRIQQYIKNVEMTTLEESGLNDINLDEEKDLILSGESKTYTGNSEQDQQKMIEKIIADQLVDIENISLINEGNKWSEKKFQKLYLKEMKRNNLILAIKAIKRILKTTDHKDIWYKKIVDLYIKIGDFKNAEYYSEKLLKIKPEKENFQKYLYIRFQNTNFFDKEKVDELQKLVISLYKKKVISVSQLSFYNFLIELLTKWNIKNTKLLLNDLVKTSSGPEKNFLLAIKKDLDIYENTKGTSLYYFKSLVALDLLKFSYFGLAKSIAEQVHIEDPHYILPIQILAYSYFFMGNYEKSIDYFQKLKEEYKDDNIENYNFFIGLSYYWLKKYENTLLFLNQVKDNNPYHLDVLRYKLLSYMEIEDKGNIINTLTLLSDYKLNYVDYYNIFKYLLNKCENCYEDNIKLIIKLLNKCYKDVDKNNEYVCWYGKAYLYNKAGKKNLAAKYFKLLSKYFQDPYIYNSLGNYYYSKNDKKKARYYYLKELLYTSKEEKRDQVKKKIKKLFFGK